MSARHHDESHRRSRSHSHIHTPIRIHILLVDWTTCSPPGLSNVTIVARFLSNFNHPHPDHTTLHPTLRPQYHTNIPIPPASPHSPHAYLPLPYLTSPHATPRTCTLHTLLALHSILLGHGKTRGNISVSPLDRVSSFHWTATLCSAFHLFGSICSYSHHCMFRSTLSILPLVPFPLFLLLRLLAAPAGLLLDGRPRCAGPADLLHRTLRQHVGALLALLPLRPVPAPVSER